MRLNKRYARRERLVLGATLIGAAVLAFATSGCARIPGFGKKEDLSSAPIKIDVRLAQPNVRPGHAMIVSISIRNVGSEILSVQMLDASSIEFYVEGPESDNTIRVRPVVSSQEPLGQVEDLESGKTLPQGQPRRFVFTTLTKAEGNYRLQAMYYPTPKGAASGLPPVIAKATAFQVAGQRSCNRDRDGVLLKDDAIEIAKRHLGRPVTAAEGLLGEDEMGFLVWRTILTVDPKDLKPGETSQYAVFVSPYLATVVPARAVQPPATPKEGKDARPERPKILPSGK